MFIIGVVCDHGVRGVLHKRAFEPLNELALETTDISIIELNQTQDTLAPARGKTDIFGSCGDVVTTSHLGDPHLWNIVVFRQLDHSTSLLIQQSAVLLYRQ